MANLQKYNMKKEIKNWRNWVLMLLMLLGLFCLTYATGDPLQEISVMRHVLHVITFLCLAALNFGLMVLFFYKWKDEGKIPFFAKMMEE